MGNEQQRGGRMRCEVNPLDEAGQGSVQMGDLRSLALPRRLNFTGNPLALETLRTCLYRLRQPQPGTWAPR